MFQTSIDENTKALIFDALDDEALTTIEKMPTVRPHELSGWLLGRMGDACTPYLRLGLPPAVLGFWFGMILGQRLRQRSDHAERRAKREAASGRG